MKTKPIIRYLGVFPRSYRSHHYFQSERRAKEFVKCVLEEYGVQGKVVKVKACK